MSFSIDATTLAFPISPLCGREPTELDFKNTQKIEDLTKSKTFWAEILNLMQKFCFRQ